MVCKYASWWRNALGIGCQYYSSINNRCVVDDGESCGAERDFSNTSLISKLSAARKDCVRHNATNMID